MSIKQKIWEKLDKDGYCLDCDLAKIYGGKQQKTHWVTFIKI